MHHLVTMIIMTPALASRLHNAIKGEQWDDQATHDALMEVDVVPDGTRLDPTSGDYDADGQPTTPIAGVLESIQYFGFDNVDGDWHL